MRKQDRIAQEQQNPSQDSSSKDSQTQSREREREQMRGSASEQKPTRHPGDKLPLPE
jgi:hypothetical protein